MKATTRSIRDWPTNDRPRDKLYNKKPAELSSAELLSMLIGPGNARCNGLELAQKVLAACDHSLSALSKCPIRDLMKVAGIGHAKASAIVAFAELSRRRQAEDALEGPRINDSLEAASYLAPLFRDLHYMAYGILFLNTAGGIIQFEMPFEGGITAAIVDVRIIFQKALMYRAVSIILCHNHVSGPAKPDKMDEALTKQLSAGAKYMDIKLLDHIIIGETGYYSFADEGKLA